MKARGANFINLIHRDSNVSPNSIIGTGLSLGSVLLEVQKFDYCKFIEYPNKN
jgi:hypothetical protein